MSIIKKHLILLLSKSSILVGGQAVIEGVMMRVPGYFATAVRNSDGEIIIERHKFTSLVKQKKILDIPIIRGAILKHLQEHSLINSSQHGFLPHRSILTNLLEFREVITQLIDEGHSVDLLYLDFSKAFDMVEHSILLEKLQHYGIRGTALSWLKSYLENREQFVSVGGKNSSKTSITYGVPQGSILGPLLFVIYINDLHYAIKYSKVHRFADDTNLFMKEDKKLLNLDLKYL